RIPLPSSNATPSAGPGRPLAVCPSLATAGLMGGKAGGLGCWETASEPSRPSSNGGGRRRSTARPPRAAALEAADGVDDHVADRHVLVMAAAAGADALDLVHGVHSFDHLAEDAVFRLVERAGVIDDVDVELGGGAVEVVGAGPGDAAAAVGQPVARLVLDGGGGFLMLLGGLEASVLDHEVGDDAVEDGVVVEPVIDVGEEVGHRDGGLVLVQLELDRAEGRLHQDVLERHGMPPKSGWRCFAEASPTGGRLTSSRGGWTR